MLVWMYVLAQFLLIRSDMREIELVRIYARMDGSHRIHQDYACHIAHWMSMLTQIREDVFPNVMARSDSMLITALIGV